MPLKQHPTLIFPYRKCFQKIAEVFHYANALHAIAKLSFFLQADLEVENCSKVSHELLITNNPPGDKCFEKNLLTVSFCCQHTQQNTTNPWVSWQFANLA
jgi:hypothetical protein